MEHDGKHALVTGSGSRIGAGTARALADAGAQVTITGRRADKLAKIAGTHANLHALVVDVDDEKSVQDGIKTVSGNRGPIQICVANAGIAEGGPFATTNLADWRRTMTANLDGVFLKVSGRYARADDCYQFYRGCARIEKRHSIYHDQARRNRPDPRPVGGIHARTDHVQRGLP